MIKKTIKYTDYNGEERIEECYFHMSTPEATRVLASFGGKSIDDIVDDMTKNGKADQILAFIEKIILGSYGKKTPDGRSFYKDAEETKLFEYSNAYAELFEELFEDPNMMEEFAKGIGVKTIQENSQPFLKPAN